MLLDYLASPSQEHPRHARMGANWSAVIKSLAAALLHSGKFALPFGPQTQFTRNSFLSEIPFADKNRDNENPPRGLAANDFSNLRLLFPKAFQDPPENVAS